MNNSTVYINNGEWNEILTETNFNKFNLSNNCYNKVFF